MISLWSALIPHLNNIHNTPHSTIEMVFGIYGNTPGIALRNWLTYFLRQCISEQENIAFHHKRPQDNETNIKLKYNQKIKSELWRLNNLYSNLNRTRYFQTIFAVNDYLITWENNDWQVLTLYNINT